MKRVWVVVLALLMAAMLFGCGNEKTVYEVKRNDITFRVDTEQKTVSDGTYVYSYSFSGEYARRFFSSYYTDIAFFACKGISMEHGISWAYDEEAALRKIMLNNTRKRILLCDSTKFNATYTSTLFGFESIDILITDKDPGPDWTAFLERQQVQLIYPGR